MSDDEDLLGDDIGDQSLADYNLGHEEEEQLLADDYESGSSQNVPPSALGYGRDIVVNDYPVHSIEYGAPGEEYSGTEERVVPNLSVDTPPTYAPYEPAHYVPPRPHDQLAVVPPPIHAAPLESPQIVPSEVNPPITNGGPRDRFISERGGQRTPRVRDIPDTLDKVVVPRSQFASRGSRTSWRNPHYSHPYRRHNQRVNFLQQRPLFPPPQIRPQLRHEPQIRLEPPQIPLNPPRSRPNPPQMRPEPPLFKPEEPQVRTEQYNPEQPQMRTEPPQFRPEQPQFRSKQPESRPDLSQFRPEQSQMRPEPPQFRPDRQPMDPPPYRPESPQMGPKPIPFRQEPSQMIPDHPPYRPESPQMGPKPSHVLLEPPPELMLLSDPPVPQMVPLFRPPRPHYKQEELGFPPRFPPMRHFMPPLDDRPNFGPRPMFDRPPHSFSYPPGPGPFNHPFRPPIREISPNRINNLPQVTIRQGSPLLPPNRKEFPHKLGNFPVEREVRMLPVQIPTSVPPGGLTGKKVLINPHFKGNFQAPGEGPAKDIDEAAERFIAEQRDALARAASRKMNTSPQRYIENTTIEIENDLMRGERERRKTEDDLLRGERERRKTEDDLLRRQEEFINANRAGLRRRMRSPSPPPPPPLPPPPPERRRPRSPSRHDELQESEYRRRVREQETLRERVLRAKEVRRRRNAVALHKQIQERDTLQQDKDRTQPERKDKSPPKERIDKSPERRASEIVKDKPKEPPKESYIKSPEKEPIVKAVPQEHQNLTPPREALPVKEKTPEIEKKTIKESPERDMTPPLPIPDIAQKKKDRNQEKKVDYDFDDLDLILDDFESILSDDEDTGRFKEKSKQSEPPKASSHVDLRTKLPPKPTEPKKPVQRQKIVFNNDVEEKRKQEKTPPKRSLLSSNKNIEPDSASDTKEKFKMSKEEDPPKSLPFNRRVVLHRKMTKPEKGIFTRADPTKPNPGIFNRAIRNTITNDNTRIVVRKQEEPQILFEDSDVEEETLLREEEAVPSVATVSNLPHGMTETRLKTLAGSEAQNISLDKEDRSATVTFNTTAAADNFKKKFNNKMVAASRLTVILQ